MKNLEQLNAVSIEKNQLKKIFGGTEAPECTLDTVTISKNGSGNDGDDSAQVGDTAC